MAEPGPLGVILLAAGASRRMGHPKQLLPVEGKPLLRHVVDGSVGPGHFLVVVLGSSAAAIRPALAGADAAIVVNSGWAEGMGSSVRAGLEEVRARAPDARGVIVALGDQPAFSRRSIDLLLRERERTGRGIVAARHGAALTPPVYFASRYFSELAALRGDIGARSLFRRHAGDLATVGFDQLSDLDTPADYARFQWNDPAG